MAHQDNGDQGNGDRGNGHQGNGDQGNGGRGNVPAVGGNTGGAWNADVIVVGAGPVGLTLACALRAGGRSVLVFDALAEGANESRAAVLHARTLEALEHIDVTPTVLAEGLIVPAFTIRDRRRVVGRLDFSRLHTRYPFTLMLSQASTERILTGRLAQLGGEVHRLHRVTAVSSNGTGGASVTVTDAGGVSREASARFVVGADGMHSVVRESQGIGFAGAGYDQSFILADVALDWPLPSAEVQLFLAPAGLAVVAPLPGGTHRIVATVQSAPERPSAADVQRLVDERGPGDARVRDVRWSSRFRVQHRLAGRYRLGSVFLAGDAAHVHSPAGGQGMNIGIQDAIELAAVLNAALADRPGTWAASDPALDRYEQVRMPVARQVIALTDRITRGATIRRPAVRAIRNGLLGAALSVPAVRRSLAERIAELR